MTWTSEQLSYLETIHINKSGMELVESRKLSPYNNVMAALIRPIVGDINITVEPYLVNHLKQDVNEVYENCIVTQLFVGLRNGKDIDYVGKLWTPKNSRRNITEQYFFRHGKPSSFDYGFRFGIGWPTNRSQVLDDRLRVYFADLLSREDIGDSLLSCILQLEAFGPEYKGITDGNILFDMVKN